MGCDIHAFIEYKDKDDSHWRNFGSEFRLPRDYVMFGILAGVRTEQPAWAAIPLRGVPADIAYATRDANELYITEKGGEQGTCTKEHAEQWVNHGSSKYTSEEKQRVTHPDWHSHSWLTFTEYNRLLVTMRLREYGNNKWISPEYKP